MRFGGNNFYGLMPYGGGTSTVEAILSALNSARGSAYATEDPNSIVYLENLCIARLVAAAWGTNRRLSYRWAPMRMPLSTLSRWEAICALPFESALTVYDRRVRLLKHFGKFGTPATETKIVPLLEEALGDVFVGLEFVDLSEAVVHVPDATPAYPYGTVVSGVPWYSTVMHILIRTQKPAGYTEGDFYEAVSKIDGIVGDMLPAWVTYNWYRPPSVGTPIAAASGGGPTAGGFYFDEPNLGVLVFV